MKQHLILKLLEELPNFPMGQAEEKIAPDTKAHSASDAFGMLFFNFISHPKDGLDVGGMLWVRLQLIP